MSVGGSSYIALRSNTGSNPTVSALDWAVLAQKGDQGIQGPVGPQGAQGATGPAGAVTGSLSALNAGRVMMAPGSPSQPMMSTTPSTSSEFVSVVMDVSSQRAASASGYWAGYVECSFDAGAIEGSITRSPVVFLDANAMSPGSEMYVNAQVTPGNVATLGCVVVQTSGGGTLPTINVVVRSAMATSIDYTDPNFASLTDLSGRAVP